MLSLPRARVRSLIGELRSHKLRSMVRAKKTKQKNPQRIGRSGFEFQSLTRFFTFAKHLMLLHGKTTTKKPAKKQKQNPRQQNPPPVSGEHCRLRGISPHVASPSPAWLCPQGMTYTASNRLPCLGFSNGRRRQRFSQWEGSAEVQPMGGVGTRQGQELRERHLLS